MDATRLLLIEDDEKLCRLLQDYLAPLGYDVEMVHDGAVLVEHEDFGAAFQFIDFRHIYWP